MCENKEKCMISWVVSYNNFNPTSHGHDFGEARILPWKRRSTSIMKGRSKASEETGNKNTGGWAVLHKCLYPEHLDFESYSKHNRRQGVTKFYILLEMPMANYIMLLHFLSSLEVDIFLFSFLSLTQPLHNSKQFWILTENGAGVLSSQSLIVSSATNFLQWYYL